MPIQCECPNCGTTLRAPDDMVGRKVRCPKCSEQFPVPDRDAPVPPPPPPPRDRDRDDDRRDFTDNPPRRPRDYDEDDRPSRRGDPDDNRRDDRPSRRGGPDEDDRPSHRRNRDEDDYDRPSRSVRRDDDDYRDDDRRPRRFADDAPDKPGAVQTAGILLLIGGILSILMALGVMLAFATTVVCCLYPSYIYALVSGILAIVKGAQLLGDKAYRSSGHAAAILLIINIVNFDLFSMGLGIVALVMLNSDEAKRYFDGSR